jgi:hypothetical protein
MALQISDTTPRVQYTATSGQTTFAVNFEFFDVADLKVYNGTTLLTYNNSPSSASQYSVTGAGVTGGGSITLGSPGATLNDSITIVRDLAIERLSDFPVSGNFPIQTLNTELDKIVAMLQQLEEQFARTLQYPVTTTTGSDVDLPELVANRVLSVNADATALLAEQELGTFQGDWAASTSYQVRDLVKDTSTGNIFFVNAAHTSSGSEPLTTNANSSKYDLIVDAAAATSSATNAANSATAAANSATAAATSETNAATSESNAATSESNASTSETNASTSATNASNSATAAATSATNAATSESNASTSETNAATSATNAASSATSAASSATTATTQASAASTSATNAATSETNAATSASNASTSETNAATSASNASTSETNAATSASNASTSATNASNSANAAATSAASAAAAYDTFDDRYLGSKTSDPTLDNDGNALVTGALYFNSSANEMRVYDGANWIAASSAGTASLIIYEYTATSGQTTFSGSDDNAASLSYSVNNLFVTLNGVVLDPDDYTATSGTSIVLGTGATTGDLLTVHAFKSFTVSELNANNLTDGTIPDARFPSVLPAVDGSNLTGITSTTINNNADNRVITGSATANTLEGEANLVFDGSNLGIGTSSPSTPLTLDIGTNNVGLYQNSTDATSGISLADNGGSINLATTSSGAFRVLVGGDANTSADNSSEAMRIDSSGNILFNTTDTTLGSTSDNGVVLTVTGEVTAARAGNVCLLNRLTSDGSLIEFRKDGSAIGTIGIDSSTITMGKTGGATFAIGGDAVVPTSSNSFDLGSTTAVWRNIYTSDFHMSNEGLDKGNDIDGTKGSWTFQEGEENLYLINNKNGKKYKFNLTEIE